MNIDAVRVLAKTIPYLQVFIGKGKTLRIWFRPCWSSLPKEATRTW